MTKLKPPRTPMNISKPELRDMLKAKRSKLSVEETEKYSQMIVNRCIALIPWERTRSIHMYLPIESRREVGTWQLLNYALQTKHPDMLVAVPVMKGRKMISFQLDKTTKWQNNPLGIPEPVSAKELADTYKFDVIIVPLIGFDLFGHRLGNGGGHYDRFLAQQKAAMTIGLGYEMCLINPAIQTESHDKSLKYVITERRIITTPNGI